MKEGFSLVLAKQILKALNDKGKLDKFAIYLETDDEKTPERLAFLCEKGYIELNGNVFSITDLGKEVLWKI
ncbi:hypothetical protein [Ammoniphilus sp. 3BR4]|uniref:hypothetical protein n=1 Tax=Ammoniphilus sp. 3BR4 TaxID=3158265 RepID=UPI0034657F05